MKRALFLLIFPFLFSPMTPLLAQEKRTVIMPAGLQTGTHRPAVTQGNQLSQNYRVTLQASIDGNAIGKLSGLTCSPRFTMTGPFGATTNSPMVNLDATLEEQDGQVGLSYSLSLGMPNSKQPISASGKLLLKKGTPYKVLEAGGVTFTLSVTAESEE